MTVWQKIVTTVALAATIGLFVYLSMAAAFQNAG